MFFIYNYSKHFHHLGLSEAMFQHNIKEIDDKKCQTEFPDDYEKYENLKKEVNTLRCC